ncbi:SMP-30/gluconolactonase/LRE family protein, partial [Acidovorax facilis]|nr:SMP-30/gluconolactonase/LRE family protein [Acidovorax facilis]
MASTWAKRVGWGVGGAVVAVAAYLAMWPVPIQPVAWTAPAAPGYQGVHAPNQRLAKLNIIDLKGEVGPEHIAFGKDGKLYTTVLSGSILRMSADGSGQEGFANTGGR